ncbi:hypothetical protein IAT38_007883 [Cryptococcus sp. DSM 104549]
MAPTRPYTRDELKSLRRADLQSLYKMHCLKGANGTNAVLIDSLVEYFASPAYREAYPPPAPAASGSTTASGQGAGARAAVGKEGRNVKPIPKRTGSGVAAGQGAGSQGGAARAMPGKRKVGVKAAPAPSNSTAGARVKAVEKEDVKEAEAAKEDDTEEQMVASSSRQPPIPTPQPSATPQPQPQPLPQTTSSLTLADVQELLQSNDAQWQSRLEAVEQRLLREVETLREELREVKAKCEELERADRPRAPRMWGSLSSGAGPSSVPRSTSNTGGPSHHYQQHSRSASLPFSSLGKRPLPVDGRLGGEGSEAAKRLRFNGAREPAASGSGSTLASASITAGAGEQPRTPSPRKPPSAFGPDYFSGLAAAAASAPAPSTHPRSGSLIPRTPSPSRQGTIPDNSQTPRLPPDWRAQLDLPVGGGGRGTPFRATRGMEHAPEFSTTPEPPMRSVSPTHEGGAGFAGARLTPGRVLVGLRGSSPEEGEGMDVDPQAQVAGLGLGMRAREGMEPSALSKVTDLERIDESEESPAGSATVTPAGQLRFPAIKPNPTLGLGMSPSAPSSASPKPKPMAKPQAPTGARSASQPNQPTHPSLLSQSLLAPPAHIARASRAGSERPPISARAPTQSPPPRPRSASAVHRPRSRHNSPHPLNLPSTVIPTEPAPRIRSASAEYMHIAMYGLEGDALDYPDAVESPLPDVDEEPEENGEGPGGEAGGVGAEKRRWRKVDEVVTPGHRTLLGTERYNDTRFGDIPIGVWGQGRVDLETPGRSL